MIIHKDFESNCKRITKEIQKKCNDINGNVILFGRVDVLVSMPLLHNFLQIGTGKYVKEINKHLIGCRVKYVMHGCYYDSSLFIKFDVSFDE